MTLPIRVRRALIAAAMFGVLLVSSPAAASPIYSDADVTADLANLQAIALAFHNYHDAVGRFPTDYFDSNGNALLSWRVALLPYLDEQDLFNQFDLTRAWDDAANAALLQQMPNVYRSPGSSAGSTDADYLGGSGANTMFAGALAATFASVTDGTSNTLLVGEAIGASIPWTRPGDIAIGTCPTLGGAGFSSFIAGVVPFAFADGSFGFLPLDIGCERLRGLFLKNDSFSDKSDVLDTPPALVPEPATASLLASGIAVLLARRRRRSSHG